MDNIIKQVIESEYRAQKILREAEEERKNAAGHTERDVLELKERILKEAGLNILRLKEDKLNSARETAEKIKQDTGAKASLMEKRFAENRELWLHSLFNKITGR